MARTLYLVAYDVFEPKRLARIGRYFKGYRVAGQKSVPEIWVTPAELASIEKDLEQLLAPEDRLYILALDPRQPRHCKGRAHSFNSNYFAIV